MQRARCMCRSVASLKFTRTRINRGKVTLWRYKKFKETLCHVYSFNSFTLKVRIQRLCEMGRTMRDIRRTNARINATGEETSIDRTAIFSILRTQDEASRRVITVEENF